MSKKGFGKFLAGAALGLGLGVLFAPKKGSETRQDLKDKMDELIKKARELDKDDVKLAIETKVNNLRRSISELDKEKALEIAKKKAHQIQEMAEDLVQYAVDKGTPVIEKVASSVRTQAISVTKGVLNKLEKEN